MSNITINLLPDGFRELPVYFATACCGYRQKSMRYPPGAQTFHQILLVVSGTGVLHCNGNTYPLSRGCAFFTAMGQESEYLDTGDLVTAFLTVRGHGMEAVLAHYGSGGFLFARPENPEQRLSAIEDIIREYYTNKRQGLLSAMAYRFFVDFFEEQRRGPVSVVEQTCLYMERHFAEKLTLDQLASVSGVSVSKLCHDFRKHRGCSVFAYILHLRLTYARGFLRSSPTVRTRDAAFASGFEDVSYFCKAYKKKFGRTPAQDRGNAYGM